jgi:hypothetical protein
VIASDPVVAKAGTGNIRFQGGETLVNISKGAPIGRVVLKVMDNACRKEF